MSPAILYPTNGDPLRLNLHPNAWDIPGLLPWEAEEPSDADRGSKQREVGETVLSGQAKEGEKWQALPRAGLFPPAICTTE